MLLVLILLQFRVLSSFAESASGIRVLSSFAESASGIRVLSSFAESAYGIRFRNPHSGSAFYPNPNIHTFFRKAVPGINHMAEAAYATGPALLGAPRFSLLFFSLKFCFLFQRGAQTVRQSGAPKSLGPPENSWHRPQTFSFCSLF
jgi:hypothetical protein